jgi:hypothetical protein
MIEFCTVMLVLLLMEKFSSRPHDTDTWSKIWSRPSLIVTPSRFWLGVRPCRNRRYRMITLVALDVDTW